MTQSWSNDEGKTWSPMTVSKLPNPNSGTDAITLNDGRQLIVYNHSTRSGAFPSGRNILNVAISNDGVNWESTLILEKAQDEYS